MELDELTAIVEPYIFKLQPKQIIPYEKDKETIIEVSVEMNLDYIRVYRGVTTILDCLSDVGGLQGLLASMVGLFLGACNYNLFDNYMASQLFTIEEVQPSDSDADSDKKDLPDKLKYPGCLTNFKDWLMDFLPDKCRCCKRSKQALALQKAREELHKEINIIDIIKSRRQLKLALELLMPNRQRQALRLASTRIHIDRRLTINEAAI